MIPTLLRMIQSLFQKTPQLPEKEHKVGIVVGHNPKDKGAFAPYPLGVSEQPFNAEVAAEMLKLANSDPRIEIKVFHRKAAATYTEEMRPVIVELNKYDPEVALELHFNWLSGAGRVEMIHYPGSIRGRVIADILVNIFGKATNTPDTKRKLITRTAGDRGGYGIHYAVCPYVLTEPFDASNSDHLHAIDNLGGPPAVARLYYTAIQEYFGYKKTFA